MALVTLEVTFVSGGGDDVASLSWVNGDADEENHYTDIHRGGRVTQETFPNHSWVVRGKQSGDVLMRIVAQAEPSLQQHRIDVDGVDEEFTRPGRRRGDRPGGGRFGRATRARPMGVHRPDLRPPQSCYQRRGASDE